MARKSAAKLTQLRSWIREFRRYFSVNGKHRICCKVATLDAQRGDSCRDGIEDCYGLCDVARGARHATITLDPLAWGSTSGPYFYALHEFIHALLAFRAGIEKVDEEEIAVDLLTRIYAPQVAEPEFYGRPLPR